MRIIGLIAASTLAAIAPTLAAAQGQQPRPAARPAPAAPQGLQVPQPAGLVVLIRSALSALNQANLTGNYTVMHALGSDTMRANTNPQTLAQSFAGFRQRGIDMSAILVLNPQLTRQPEITGGRLHLVGRFPSQPVSMGFDLWFEMSQNRWKLVQLNANLAPNQAQQPQQGQRPAPPGQPRQAPRRP